MAGLDFMESLALGMIAGRSSGSLAEQGVAVLSDLQHKQQAAQADAAYAALVDEYNAVVDRHDTVVERFWRVHGWYKSWREYGEKQKARVDELKAELAAANERADIADRLRVETAAREAEARRDAVYWKDAADRRGNMATQDARALNKAKAEIARLEAIIATLRQDGQGA